LQSTTAIELGGELVQPVESLGRVHERSYGTVDVHQRLTLTALLPRARELVPRLAIENSTSGVLAHAPMADEPPVVLQRQVRPPLLEVEGDSCRDALAPDAS
jgi:hypothetical protein